MKLPEELRNAINDYKSKTKWYQRWNLVVIAVPLAIPIIVLILAALAGLSVAEWIAIKCTDGTMPAALQWLCF